MPGGLFDNPTYANSGQGMGLLNSFSATYNQPLYQAMQQRQAQDAMYRALMEQQQSPTAAAGAAFNPALAQQLIPQAFPQTEVKSVVDPYSQQTNWYAVRGGHNPSVSGVPVTGAQGTSTTTNDLAEELTSMRDAGATEDKLLEKIPAGIRATVKALINGQALPTATSMRGALRDNSIRLAQIVDPSFDMSEYPARVKARGSWTSGPDAKSAQALNQGLVHVADVLIPAMQALPGHQVPLANAAENAIRTQLLGAGAQGGFETAAHAVSEEIAKIWKQNNLSDTEIRAWEKNLSPNMSPDQQRTQVNALHDLIEGGLSTLNYKRQQALGPRLHQQLGGGSIASPEGQAAMGRLNDFGHGRPAEPAAKIQAVGAPKIDEVRDGYRFKGGNPGDPNSWVKVK